MNDATARLATRLIAIAPLLLLAAFAVVRLEAPASVGRLVKEDGVLEYLQVLTYGVAGIGASLVWVSTRSSRLRWTFLALAVGCVFVGAEEISWGERLLGFEPPAVIREFNTQDEMSLHNLEPIQRLLHPAYIVAGLVGAFGWWIARRLPAGRTRRAAERILPDRFTLLYFLPVALFYLYVEATGLPTTGWLRIQDQEVFETLLAAGVAVFAWSRVVQLRRGDGDPTAFSRDHPGDASVGPGG